MGIIKKQAIKGSIWSYLGVALGFVNLGVLSQRFLTTEQVGLTQVLISFAAILSQIGTLGFGNVAMRLFPHFRNDSNKHNGFIGLSILVCFCGFVLMSIFSFSFESFFVHSNLQKSSLLTENYFYVYPLIFFMLFFSIFDSYNRMLYNAAMGTFLREFFLRILNTIVIVLFIFKIITFDGFIFLFVISQAIPTVIITLSLWMRNQLTFKFDFSFVNKGLKREMIDVALFGIISALSGMALQNIDRLLVNRFIGLNAAGIYSVTFFFATLILISQRAISNISTTVISESWKMNDVKTISDIYVKSSINQFIIGVLIFIGIWGNIDNIFHLLKPEYVAGKWVIFFIGLSNLVTVLSGVAIYILATSKYYRYHMWFMLFLIILVVLTNVIFIPIWGLTGAAVASFVSTTTYILFACLFLYRKFKIQPLRWKHIGIILAGVVAYLVASVVPPLSNYIIDIGMRSSVLTIVFMGLIIIFKSSDEINLMLVKYWGRYIHRNN
jgi:O-antigen/teichoic acid export membrane protein